MNARLRLSVAVAGAAALLAVAAQAQTHIRPGLWEERITVKSDNPQANAAMAQMQEKLASMPPEQRAAIEKMMAGHGIGAGAAPNSVRTCITKEQTERGFTPDNNGRCQRTHVSRSGNVTKFDFTCTSAHSDVSGHGQLTELGDSAFAMTSAADMVTKTSSMHTQTDIVGKFVASDCGDVKPAEVPAAH
jgi:hypothetical protein